MQLEIITGVPPDILPYLEAGSEGVSSVLQPGSFCAVPEAGQEAAILHGPMVIAGWGNRRQRLRRRSRNSNVWIWNAALSTAKKVLASREVEDLSAANTSPVPIRLGFDSYSIRDFRWKDVNCSITRQVSSWIRFSFSSLADYESLERSTSPKSRNMAGARGHPDRRGSWLHLHVVERMVPKTARPKNCCEGGCAVAKL